MKGFRAPRRPSTPAGRVESPHRPPLVDEHQGPSRRTDSGEALWRWRGLILAVALGVGLFTYVASEFLISDVYESQALVRVSAHVGATSEDGVLASNALAAQYATLAPAGPVVTKAEADLGLPAGGLDGKVSGGTVGNENLVQIKVRADTPSAAQTEADAVGAAFISEVQRANERQALAFQTDVRARLAGLDEDIDALQAEITDFPAFAATASNAGPLSALLTSKRAGLTTLVNQRDQVRSSIATTAADLQPALSVWSDAHPGERIRPRPLLYGLIAAGLALLLCIQVVIIAARRG